MSSYPEHLFDEDDLPSVTDVIGNTPLVALRTLNDNPLAQVFVKLEYMNPSGSIKDRIAKHIIETFERQGKLKPGGVVVENSSGNTAAAVAMLCAMKGYECIIVVPEKCSEEKKNAIMAFGAKLVVAPDGVSSDSPDHYENIAKRLEKEIPGAVRLDQYNNYLNVEAHYLSTGPEIWKQSEGSIDYFVAGASTGGTISGTGKYLKEISQNHVRIVAADPNGSCVYNYVKNRQFTSNGKRTEIEGIGKNYHCDCLHFEVIDDAIQVDDVDAFQTARRLARQEGILCGISSGANVWAALQIAKQATVPTRIVTVLPDGGFKYFSKIYNNDFLTSKRIMPSEMLEKQSSYNFREIVNMYKQN
jgi:cystathionine beta-synthase